MRLLAILPIACVVAGSPPLLAGEPQPGGAQEAVPLSAQVDTGPNELSAAYRSLYLAFANADRPAAIERTAAFERATLVAEPKKAFERLSEADSRLFAHVARLRPEALLSLVLFYQELAYRHAADKNYGMLLRADRATEELLGRLTQKATSDEERRVVSAAYQGFAVDLLDIHAPARAGEMLEHALTLTPDDVNANLTLAILLQKEERYAAAAIRLDRALRVEPGNREARLRRAILRARVETEGKAATELEALSASPENDWIAIIATQERGRALMARGKWDRAIGWFHAAAKRFPVEHSFRVALAYSQSRAGRRESARDSAKASLDAPRDRLPSARRRFAEPPKRLIEARRVETRLAAETRWDALRLALAPMTGGPGLQSSTQ